jgi:hypothetical protein
MLEPRPEQTRLLSQSHSPVYIALLSLNLVRVVGEDAFSCVTTSYSWMLG